MFSVLGVVILLIFKTKSNADEDLYNSNGWKPLLNEKVPESLQRNSIRAPNTVDSTDLHYMINPNLFLKENIEQKTDLKPLDINRRLMREENEDEFEINEKQNHMSITDKKHNSNPDYLLDDEPTITHELIHWTSNNNYDGHSRQAKNINENTDLNIIDNHDIIKETPKVKETYDTNNKSNIYEVSEATDASEVLNSLVVKGGADTKKPYFEPNFASTSEKNLSNILVNILSNYNIRTNDDLTNYAISRSKQTSNTYKQGYIYPTPIRIRPMWNSQNHFPLDPLLAVFLSNYGYYLPGFYGFPGNYHNIYGYLASNNIHNNKPFGAYKIYSDTDSSH